MCYSITSNRSVKAVKRLSEIWLIPLFFLLLSCGSEQTNDKNEKYYYDLKGFVDNQIVYLDEKKPMVYKTTMLNGKKEIGKSTNIDWKKELELFIQADINKPAYRQSYDVVRKDSSEYEYTLRPNMNLPVRYLKIVTDKSINQPLYVKALLKSENKIYDSEKSIELICTKANNLWELKSFSVHGYQKLIFMDKKLFQIESKIGL